MGSLALQLQGTEFCQQPQEQETDDPLKACRKERSPADISG